MSDAATRMRLVAAPLTAAAFAPFGDVIETEGRAHYPINAGTAQTLSAKSNSYAALAAAAPPAGGGPVREKGMPGIHRPMLPGLPPPSAPAA